MEFETFEISVCRGVNMEKLADPTADRGQAIEGAAGVASEAIALLIGRLADRVLGRPDVGDDGWLEYARAQAELTGRQRDQHLREWHLVKMQIERRLGLDHTGNALNAHRYGASWQAIATACGITRQAAHDRWADLYDDLYQQPPAEDRKGDADNDSLDTAATTGLREPPRVR